MDIEEAKRQIGYQVEIECRIWSLEGKIYLSDANYLVDSHKCNELSLILNQDIRYSLLQTVLLRGGSDRFLLTQGKATVEYFDKPTEGFLVESLIIEDHYYNGVGIEYGSHQVNLSSEFITKGKEKFDNAPNYFDI